MAESRVRRLAAAVGLALSAGACGSPDLTWHEGDGYRWADLAPGRLGSDGFAVVPGSRTGIHVANEVTDEDVAANRHYLNGSGVAAGDVNGDGRVDLYFARLAGPNVLYLNRGGLEFEDVTEAAGVAHLGHASTGVGLADVDGDRDLLVAGTRTHQQGPRRSGPSIVRATGLPSGLHAVSIGPVVTGGSMCRSTLYECPYRLGPARRTAKATVVKRTAIYAARRYGIMEAGWGPFRWEAQRARYYPR